MFPPIHHQALAAESQEIELSHSFDIVAFNPVQALPTPGGGAGFVAGSCSGFAQVATVVEKQWRRKVLLLCCLW